MDRTGEERVDQTCIQVAKELRIAYVALDAALDSIIVHRLDGTLVHFNRAAAEMHGMTHAEFAALPPWGWTEYADPGVREARVRAICDDGDSMFRSSKTMPDGAEHHMEVHAGCVDTEDGLVIVSVVRDVTAEVRATEMLERLAFHDPLTGLANRALFDERLEMAIAGARRHGDLVGIVYLDVDDFKEINDNLGHDAGDRVLVTMADRLSTAVRPDDTVARLGGDEFVVVCPRLADASALDAAAARLVERIGEPLMVGFEELHLAASAGVALFDPAVDDARSLLMHADETMYATKRERIAAL